MDALVNHIWQSTIVAAGAGVLALMFRNNSADVRYWIWFAAAIKFLVPFAALSAAARVIPPLPPSGRAVDAFETATNVFRSASLPPMSNVMVTVLIAVWMSGAVLVLANWLWQWRRLVMHVRVSPAIVDGIVHDALRRIERAEGIGVPTRIVSSTFQVEPGVLGIRHPVLIWPRHLTSELGDRHVEAVIAHEVCHIARRDNLLALAQMVTSALFWFHPFVWWIGARLVDERERACDERVLARGGHPATYAESILKTCQLCITSPLVNLAGVTGGELKVRIRRICRNASPTPLGLGKKCALMLALLVAVFAPIVGSGESRTASAAPPQDRDQEVERPGGRVTSPKLIREVKPQYTARAMQEKVEGEVLMECVVKADGTVGDKKIIKALHPDLDQAALDAVAQWLFEPGTRDGKPANVLVTIAMAFTLKN